MGFFSRKEDLVLEADDDDGLTPFAILTKAVCSIARKTCSEQENLVPPKKRSSYFNFLEDMAGPSKTNTMPTTSKHDQVVVAVDEDENSRNKKRPHCRIQEIPCLIERCCPPIPKKPRSPRSSSPNSIVLFGQKITMKSASPSSTSAATDESDDRIHRVQTMKMNNLTLKIRESSEIDNHDNKCLKLNKNEEKKRKKKEIKKLYKKGRPGVDEPIPDLPEEFKKVILGERNGAKLQILVQKTLSESDIKTGQGRLSLPPGQVSGKKFLKRKEAKFHKKHTFVSVPLIDPRLEEREISLGWWKMSNSSNSYVLKSTWNNIVRDYGFKSGYVVQVWSFSAIHPKYEINDDAVADVDDEDVDDYHNIDDDDTENGQLHLALVVVKPMEEGDKESTTTTNGGSSSSNVISNNRSTGETEKSEIDGIGGDRSSCSRSQTQRKLVDGSSTGSCSPPN